MNIAVVSQDTKLINEDDIKCEVTTEFLKRWTNSNGSPRYIDIKIGTVDIELDHENYFCGGRSHCDFPAYREGSFMPANKCGVQVQGVIDTHYPDAYTAKHSMIENEQLLSLGVHNVFVTKDGKRAKMLISRHLAGTSSLSDGDYLTYSSTVIASKTEHGWSFYE